MSGETLCYVIRYQLDVNLYYPFGNFHCWLHPHTVSLTSLMDRFLFRQWGNRLTKLSCCEIRNTTTTTGKKKKTGKKSSWRRLVETFGTPTKEIEPQCHHFFAPGKRRLTLKTPNTPITIIICLLGAAASIEVGSLRHSP